MKRDPSPESSRAARSETSRDRLLDAARDLFSERGFHATSTRSIAARAGCNLSLIRYYFGGKEGLLRAVVGRNVEAVRAELGMLAAEPAPIDEILDRFVGFMVPFFDRNQAFLRLVFHELLVTENPLLEDIRGFATGTREIVSGMLQDAMDRGRIRRLDPPTTAMLLVSMMLFYFLAYPITSVVLGPRSPERLESLRKHIVDVYLHGILPRSARARKPGRRASARPAKRRGGFR